VVQKTFLSSAEFINTQRLYLIQAEALKKYAQIRDFQNELIRQLIEKYAQPNSRTGRPIIGDNPIRLTARHFPSLVPATLAKQTAQRPCVVCSHTTRRGKKSVPIHVISVTFVTLGFVL
jgi:hypothetical protein